MNLNCDFLFINMTGERMLIQNFDLFCSKYTILINNTENIILMVNKRLNIS